ncbi:hypothetical protein TASIC1_0001083500 [Trichoderma asperellum]|uniref:Uncharacterized protein n=1 Tax=Trichoderma asperellum TaxID=101201 RepID=A0A6V8QQD5_TRIAP|nr:hypothetical protein TASIC1_0001083500 [Trichoderma asperellum]
MQPPSLWKGQPQVDKGLLAALLVYRSSSGNVPCTKESKAVICRVWLHLFVVTTACFACQLQPQLAVLPCPGDDGHMEITVLVLPQSIPGEPSSISYRGEQKQASVWIPMIAAGYSVWLLVIGGDRSRGDPLLGSRWAP